MLYWVLQLKPDADEIIQLAALAHDIERARPDRLQRNNFATIDEYKREHARLSGEIAAGVVRELGYTDMEAQRLFAIIALHESPSDNEDAMLLLDADSISFFESNLPFFVQRKNSVREKIVFMYTRASEKAKDIIYQIMTKSEFKLLFQEAIRQEEK